MDGQRLVLAIYIGSFGLGGVLIASLTLRRALPQIAMAVLIALAGYGLFHTEEQVEDLLPTPGGDLLGFIAIALATLAIGHFVFQMLIVDFGKTLAEKLQPRKWTKPEVPSTSMEVAKRWFVTIAASTGSLVAALAVNKEFPRLLAESLSPQRLVIAVIVTVVSIVLIGPVEEYVFGAGLRAVSREGSEAGGEQAGHFERLLQNMSWKAAGRVGLVLLLIFMINVTHSCLEEQLTGGRSETNALIILATVQPAVSTYFWCSALQRTTQHLAARSTEGAVVAGMLLFLPATVIFAVAMLAGQSIGSSSNPLGFLIAAAVVALALGAVVTGLPTFVGALALNAQRNRPAIPPVQAVAMIMAGLAVLTILMAVGFIVVMGMLGVKTGGRSAFSALVLPGIASSVGWGFGLLVSGFPAILRRSAPASGAAAAA